jgi:hypothetical protein
MFRGRDMQELEGYYVPERPSSSLRSLLREFHPRSPMSRPAEVVKLFVRQLELGKIRDAVKMLPEWIVKSVGAAKLESIFFDNAAELRTRGGILRLEIVGERADDRSAEVDVSMRYQDGTIDTEHIVLVKEKREWKVDMTK